ncbi:MAG: 2Fe-2S iron-sulfur cluster-binding protein [SAR324 cluster bacterium]|jgi:2Fe-2S ferredoxin|nr:2Fe-2S iron-sulfur cluster-binding protein [SAR324 cluster bacterium]MDP7047011.1 2Fe-2S iron-sulfur cluster-binding protein [SAR324 cluster bacterium]MEE3267071.1 2Fe-2S iron-sulfur cluster-binding protein [SAR324 cluster bacterium]
MAGTNPYIEKAEFELPQQNYNATFLPMKKKVEISVEKISTENDGLPGSILNAALAAGIDLDHSCGGVCACSTCHIIVREGFESCNDATDDEEDMLDLAPGLEPQSRLACQCVPNGSQSVIIEIPEWNRNLVSEDH